jgi:hypothetical protein
MRSIDRTVTLLAASASLMGCLSSRPVSPSPGENGATLGSFSVVSSTLGAQGLVPTTCAAGDRQFFLGADFSGDQGGLVLRLVVDPLGEPSVRLFAEDAPFDKSVVFHRHECSVFHMSLDTTGWRVNDVYDYRVSLELDCRRGEEAIRGQASATHCH